MSNEAVSAHEKVGIQKIEPVAIASKNRQRLTVIPAFDTRGLPAYREASVSTKIDVNNPYENPFQSL